jgi:hypothetical protein
MESDRLYFETDAKIEVLSGATIASMTGLTTIPAGCVVHRLNADNVKESWDEWLDDIERRLKQLESSNFRLYLDNSIPELEKVLLKRGYHSQIEVALLDEKLSFDKFCKDLPVTLRLVLDADDWQHKLELHSEKEPGSDGHITDSQAWVELERRKCATRVMNLYFICVGDDICGTVGSIKVNGLLRLKNLMVHSSWREKKIGKAAVQALRNIAIESDMEAFGCFALLNSHGQKTYESAGLKVVSEQTEWIKVNMNK